jgi:hypothetical protein
VMIAEVPAAAGTGGHETRSNAASILYGAATKR